jgi:uroporphyrinogen III methyltransferase/synthase
MESVSPNARLAGRTVLVAPETLPELTTALEHHGARVITWPEIQISEPESFAALDEAIENLFGYDWLLFRTANAAEFFLKRFQELGHEVSGLDTLRVCAIGEATGRKLETSQVHIDVIPGSTSSNIIVDAIGNYVGGRQALGRLNFLIPRASAARDGLCDLLEETGARVDLVIAYRTVSHNAALAQLTALLVGGAVDGVAFDSPQSVRALAELFDALELATILAGARVFTFDESTTNAADDYGLRPFLSAEPITPAMADAMADHFHDYK